jgi:hypothetical protein
MLSAGSDMRASERGVGHVTGAPPGILGAGAMTETGTISISVTIGRPCHTSKRFQTAFLPTAPAKKDGYISTSKPIRDGLVAAWLLDTVAWSAISGPRRRPPTVRGAGG